MPAQHFADAREKLGETGRGDLRWINGIVFY